MEFKYSHVKKEMEVYGYDHVVKSYCRMCHGGCGVLVYVKDGKVAKIAGDPDCPINHGTICSKAMASAQLAYHPDRVTHPLRRIGPKGSGKGDRRETLGATPLYHVSQLHPRSHDARIVPQRLEGAILGNSQDLGVGGSDNG